MSSMTAFNKAWDFLKALPEQQMTWPTTPNPVHTNPSTFNQTLRGIPFETLMEEGFKPDKHRPRVYDDAPTSERDFRMVGRNENKLLWPRPTATVSEGTVHPAIRSMIERKLSNPFGYANLNLINDGWNEPQITRTPQQNMAEYDRAREQSQSAERT